MRHVIIPVLTLALAGCAEAAADRPVVERSDSAGVEIVRTLGADRPIAWRFEPVLTLGGAEDGPESFYQIYSDAVSTDSVGNIYVLDQGNHRIVVFDPEGRPLRTMGSKGGGPGEFEWVSGFSVAPDGTASVFDYRSRSFIRWDANGELLPSEPVEVPYRGGPVARGPDGSLLMSLDEFDGEARTTRRVLIAAQGGDTTEIASFVQAQVEPRDFGCVQISGMPPLLTPDLVWTAGGGRVFSSAGTEYAIDVFDSGRRVTSIRRDLPPRQVTREMAIREVGEAMKVSFGGGGGCEIPPDKVMEVRGHAPLIQPVKRMTIGPDGTMWVERGRIKDEDALIDLFDADGVYIGTLPPGAQFPAAFTPGGDVITIEKDDLDVEHIVVYRVHRDA